uniref:Uncharacterized protein n=1 Tax=Anguilla anguilla TaxID=7936 RepID=A0A0E9XUY7_ANGAN
MKWEYLASCSRLFQNSGNQPYVL